MIDYRVIPYTRIRILADVLQSIIVTENISVLFYHYFYIH